MTGPQQRQAGTGPRKFPRPMPASLLRRHSAGLGTAALAAALVGAALLGAVGPGGWTHGSSGSRLLSTEAPALHLAWW